MQLVLSLMPGLDLLGRAFQEEGFCVVQGGDVIWGGDVRTEHYPAGKFDGIISGPPCQAFSRLAHMVRQNGLEPKFGNLIPEFERCVLEAQPQWFLMENVPDAPRPRVNGYDVYSNMLNNRQCVDEEGKPATVNRLRCWSWGWRGQNRPPLMVDVVALENPVFERAALGGSDTREIPIKLGSPGKRKTALSFTANGRLSLAALCKKQGLPPDFLEHAPFTAAAKCKAVGNGVPLPMGRAIARAVREAVEDHPT